MAVDTPQASTPAQRAMQVLQINANQALEGLRPDETDKAIQARYINGTASLADILQHARDFVAGVKGARDRP